MMSVGFREVRGGACGGQGKGKTNNVSGSVRPVVGTPGTSSRVPQDDSHLSTRAPSNRKGKTRTL